MEEVFLMFYLSKLLKNIVRGLYARQLCTSVVLHQHSWSNKPLFQTVQYLLYSIAKAYSYGSS